ncbi:RHS repeat-associated core domain-containing protein, partial [Bacteroides faecichinchillae]|uniref:RHS repeat-associated core domain-containing protein n=1 Tax=Bacteroides faecichinchillae TaxID=871325 RepID=UPI003511D9C6
RVVADKDGTVEETNSYYPFGGMFTSVNSVQPYKYNGKELERKNGLNCYDYGARQYDAVLGRWTTVDPMSEKCYKYSPFIYCNDCPVKYIDPDGNSTQIPPFVFGGANPILTTGSRITMLGTTDKVLRLLPKEQHHIIPRSLKGNEVVKSAREGGFKIEGKENKISVDKFNKSTGEGQHGKHPNYTNQIRNKLEKFQEKNPNASPEQSVSFIKETVSGTKNVIESNPNTKINDLEIKGLSLPIDQLKVVKPIETIKPIKRVNFGEA